MILQPFFNTQLAQASYLVACPQSKQAIVIDPTLDLSPYLRFAAAQGLRIAIVTETHIHADFLSGAAALATACNAELLLSGETEKGSGYDVSGVASWRPLHDGDVFHVGKLEFRAIHTPGHTPEHLTFAVTDPGKRADPVCLFTGDFLFAGDVGRPDLAERSAGRAGTMQAAAALLFASVQKAKLWRGDQVVWPGHRAGSACGKALDAVPATSAGFECSTNWAFGMESEADFVTEALNEQPEPPAYFGRMKKMNRVPSATPADTNVPAEIGSAEELASILRDGTLPVDLRETRRFVRSYLKTAIHLPAGLSTVKWGGSVLEPEHALLLIADSAEQAAHYALQFALIGLGPCVGWLWARVIEEKIWPLPELKTMTEMNPGKSGAGEFQAVDVRDPAEYRRGHYRGALNWPLTTIRQRLNPAQQRPILLQCQTGTRSTIAASLFEREGWTRVASLEGGLAAYPDLVTI